MDPEIEFVKGSEKLKDWKPRSVYLFEYYINLQWSLVNCKEFVSQNYLYYK